MGFALADQELIDAAIDGRSGFRFQMEKSVTPDGFWYEGAWGYHFYALDPLLRLAEMGAKNGYDLYAAEPLKRMFDAPLRMLLPSGNLPAFNDSKEVNLYGYDALYEFAWAHYADPAYAAVLGTRTRGLNALLFGSEDVPKAALEGLKSAAFPDSGYAVLRAPQGDYTVAMKFGPHGGGHGHYDKLNFVSYANGATQALDPGTQSYAAPTHNTWDKVTIAHNTVTVDETTQNEAAGHLEWADLEGETYRAVRAMGGAAYSSATLARTMLVTAEYALDVFEAAGTDGQEHTFDWAYHSDGVVTGDPGLQFDAFSGFPAKNGYQHITETTAAQTAGAWQAVIDQGQAPYALTMGVYNSSANVTGAASSSKEQWVSEPSSARLRYTFNGSGYILYTYAQLPKQPDLAPGAITFWLYGDGSGHKVAFRINDATDERFVAPAVKMDWTGWRKLEVTLPETWSHYLGNNDGRVDLPVKSVSIELTNAGGDAPKTGDLYLDEVTFFYEGAPELAAAQFDPPKRKMRLWMLGGADTTVVLGRGLGPVLPNTSACVVARRKAQQTSFVTLMEPYKEDPRIWWFGRDEEGRYVVEGAGFRDTFRIEADGVKEFVRTQ